MIFFKRGFLSLLFFLGTLGSALGQDMIDAFRGDEIEDRSYSFDPQYFLNALSFAFDLGLEKPWDLAANGYRGTVGSLNSREILLRQEMKMLFPGDENFSARMHFLQTEDFDSRYMRFMFEPQVRLDANWAVGVPLQVMPAKEDLDLGVSLTYRDEGIHYLKFVWLFQNAFFNSETRQNQRYESNPGTLAIQGSVEPCPNVWLQWTIGQVLPLKLSVEDELFDFRFSRFFYRAHLQATTGKDSELFVALSGEQAYKIREYEPLFSNLDRSLHRSAAKARVEWRKALGEGTGILGVQYFGFRESDELLEQPSLSEFNFRRESTVYAGYRFAVGQASSMTITGYVDFQNNVTQESSTGYIEEKDDVPLSKLDFAFRHAFSPKASLVINPTLQFFGSTIYGGTNVQLMVTF